MPKLHEWLPIETSLENQANKCRTELMATFEKKRHLFEEKRVVFFPKGENEQSKIEIQSDINTTVQKELKWLSEFIIKGLDASYQVAEANTLARADVVLEDDKETILLKGVPATALLELEKRIAEIHALVAAIPTLDPAKGFVIDVDRPFGTYKAREVEKTRTQKTNQPVVLYDATDKHPAQVQLLQVDVPIGRIQEQEWSGLITPSNKADLIGRAEQVMRAVKRARARANEADVPVKKKIGAEVVKYIFGIE